MNTQRLLLDTHVVIWWRMGGDRLNEAARQAIGLASLVYVSAASAWETAIKTSLGKLRIPESFEAGVIDSGFQKLNIAFAHAEGVAALPLHHRDPFDRLLIAQARSENLTLVTGDRQLEAYDVPVLWAASNT